MLAGLALIAGQLGWTAALLAHSYFRQSDFALLDRALHEGFGWKYLTQVDGGHLMPAGLAIIWALARISLYNWLFASVIIMVGVAAASLAMLRMLLTVFARPGARTGQQRNPAILLPLAVYLFIPLSAGGVAWLSVAVRILPLQLGMFMAVHAHVRFVREGRIRQLAAAAVWLVVGMAAADQGVLVPALLFALTAAYFEPGRPREAVALAFVRYRRAWAVYGLLVAAYCAIFFTRLIGSGVNVAGPGQATSLYEFAGAVLGRAAVPSLFGGPWQWGTGGYSLAAPPIALEYLSWVVAAALVVASCLIRPGAWRAWAILLGWVVVAAILPAAIGGFGLQATALGAETGYLANATGVLALCLGLAFLPPGQPAQEQPAQEQPAREQPAQDQPSRLTRRAVRAVALAAFCCFVAGTVVSSRAFESVNSGTAARSYVETARLAVARAPRGTLIVDGPTPATVIDPGFFAGQAGTAQVIGPLVRGRTPVWTAGLDGVLAGPMTFDAKGRLRPVTVAGVTSLPPPRGKGRGKGRGNGCWDVANAEATAIPLSGTLYRWPWTVRLVYTGPAGMLLVRFGDSASEQFAVAAGTHVVYAAQTGEGNTLDVQFIANDPGPACVKGVAVGLVQPDSRGKGIPAAPVPG